MKRTPPTLTLLVLVAASACAGNGPPPRVAEVPIDEGQPRILAPASAPAIAGGPSGQGGSAAVGLAGDPGAAFGGGGGGSAGGGPSGAGSGAGGAGGGENFPVQLPPMLPTMKMTDVAAAGSPAGAPGATPRPLPPKAERLTAADCNKIMDRYIELVGISQGISPDSIAGVMPMLRNSVANDPSYTNALGACVKENTKTQYRCALKATDVDGWKQCLQ